MKKLLLAFVLLIPLFAHAASCEATRPVHQAWYQLDGAHALSVCGCTNCHINNVFKGTPRTCNACHNGRGGATPKGATHIPTNMECDTCHRVSKMSFADATMNHTGIVTGCDTCHNGTSFQGITVTGKQSNHIPTTASCETCHRSFTSWDANWSHQGVVAGSCSTCHNGTYAKGKSANHIPTVLECDSCHKTYSGWTGVSASDVHAGVTTGCTTCHNGSFASSGAVGTPATVDHNPMAGKGCEECHVTSTWKCN